MANLSVMETDGTVKTIALDGINNYIPRKGEVIMFDGRVEDYSFEISGSDIILTLPDGEELVLVNMADMLAEQDEENPTKLTISSEDEGDVLVLDNYGTLTEIIEAAAAGEEGADANLARNFSQTGLFDESQNNTIILSSIDTEEIQNDRRSFVDAEDTNSEDDTSPSTSFDTVPPSVPTIDLTSITDTEEPTVMILEDINDDGTLANSKMDERAPTITINDTTTTDDTTPTFRGTVDDPDATITVTVNGETYTGTNNGDGTWSLTLPDEDALSDGDYTVSATATDTDNNTSTPASDDFTVDSTALTTDDTATVGEDSSVYIDVLANDEAGSTITSVNTPTNSSGEPLGTVEIVSVDGVQQIKFTPAENYDALMAGESEDVSFTYQTQDALGNTGEASVTVTIEGVSNDLSYVSESAAFKNVVGYYELDENGDPISPATIVIDDQNGMESGTHLADLDPSKEYGFFILPNKADLVDENSVIEVDSDGNVNIINGDTTISDVTIYHDNPELNDDGKDHFIMESNGNGGTTIKIEDLSGLGDADFTDVVLNLDFEIADKIGDDTQAKNDTASTTEDSAVTINVLANDKDGSGDDLEITSVQSPVMLNGVAVGTAEIVNGQIVFTPNDELDSLAEGETQQLSFTYSISDGNQGSDTATVSLTVTGTNDAPVIEITDTTVTEDVAQIIANVDDIDGTIDSSNLSAANGTVTIDENGDITYTPNADFNGTDTVTISVTDNNGATTTQTFNVTVEGVNDGPDAVDDTVETVLLSESFENRSAGAGDEDHGSWYVENGDNGTNVFTGDSGSQWTVNNAGVEIQDTGVDGETSSDGVNHAELDPHGDGNGAISTTIDTSGQDSIRITFDFNPRNDNSSSSDMKFTIDGTEYVISHEGSISPENSGLTIGDSNADGWFTVTGEFDVNSDSVDISFEGAGTADTYGALLDNIEVTGISSSLTTEEDTIITIDASTLLANDTDADGDTLTIESVQGATNGTVSLDSDGNVVFTPAVDYNGDASFTYTISDGNGGTSTATVTLDVTSINDEPEINIQSTATVNEDGKLTIVAADYSVTDEEDDSLTPSLSAENGAVSIDENGNIIYTPNEDYNGTDTITVTAMDSDGAQTTQTITVTVNPINDGSETTDDSVSTLEDTVLTLGVNDFGDYSDTEGDDLSAVQIVSLPVAGVITLNGVEVEVADEISVDDINNGVLKFTPASNSDVDVSFDFKVSDGTNWSQSATTTINVEAVADTPVNVSIDVEASGNVSYSNINMVVNGSFEDTTTDAIQVRGSTSLNAGSGGWTGLSEMSGWTLITDEGASAPVMEVHDAGHAGVGATDGNNYMDLGETNSGDSDNDNTQIGQVINTVDGVSYSMSFDFVDKASMQESDTSGENSGVLEVYWGGELVATIDGNNSNWQTETLELLGGAGDGSNMLSFKEVGEGNDNWGMAIDNIYMAPTENMIEYNVDVSAMLADTDGSESLSVTLSGLPDGATLEIGEAGSEPGTWIIPVDGNNLDLTDVKMHIPESTDTFNISATATATDSNGNATITIESEISEDDLNDITASVTSTEDDSNDSLILQTDGEGYVTLFDFDSLSQDQVDSLDAIDMSNSSSTLEGLDVDDFITHETNSDDEQIMKIIGNSDDELKLDTEGDDAQWTKTDDTVTDEDGNEFDIYQSGDESVKLYVDTDIVVNEI